MLLLLASILLGYGFLGLFPKSVNLIFKALICPSIGLLLFAELSIFYSFIFGFNITSIVLSLISLSLISFVSFNIFKFSIVFEKVSTIFLLSLTIIVAFSSYILFTQVLSTKNGNLQTGGGGLYGDTALHLAYTSRIQTGEFPPQNPLFAGRMLVYPYANDLLSAALRINGMDLNFAFILPQIIFLIGFITLFYVYARKFTNDVGFLISETLFFLGWGAGFYYYIREYFAQNAPLLPTREFTNNPDLNLYLHNIFTGLIFPERSFLPGIFLALLSFISFCEYFKSKSLRFLIINSVILGILPFWHTHTFIFVSICYLMFGVYLLANDLRGNFLNLALSFFISFLLVLPFLYLFWTSHITESFLKFSFGWIEEGDNIIVFWLRNSFLIIPFAILGLLKIKNDLRLYFIGPFASFVVANFIIFQPWNWDNIKLISLSFLFFSILAGVFLNWLFQKNLFSKIIVTVLILASSISGILSITFQARGKFIIYDTSDIALADWAGKSTGIDDVFLIEPMPNHPIPALSGRLVYVGYPGHLWVHGIDYSERVNLTNAIIGGDFSTIAKAEVPISYVIFPKNISIINSQLPLIFENDKYLVVKLFK